MIELGLFVRIDRIFFCVIYTIVYFCTKEIVITINGLFDEIKSDLHKYEDS